MDHCNFWLRKALDGKTLILYGARIHVLTRDRYERRVTEAKGQGPRLRLVLANVGRAILRSGKSGVAPRYVRTSFGCGLMTAGAALPLEKIGSSTDEHR
jgi:hypothetical protein